MRKLLNTLFVLTPESYLSLDGETVVVNQGGAEAARFPLHTLEGILTFAYAGASPALMGACAERGIDLAFFTPKGRFLARTVGEERGNVLLRQEQYRTADDPMISCRYACGFILGKAYNARWVLERATRDHPQRVPWNGSSRFLRNWQLRCRVSGNAVHWRNCAGWREKRLSGILMRLTALFCSSETPLHSLFAAAARRSTPSMRCCRLRIRCLRASVRLPCKALDWTRMWDFCTARVRDAPAWRWT